MASRLDYAPAIARQLLLDTARRLRPGGLAALAASWPGGKQLVIVTGAGRSGTSAVARVLHESGVSMGSEMGEASESNPEGYYEDLDVLWLNERLMAELGMSGVWRRNRGRWSWRSTVLAVARRYRDEMAELVSKAGGGWKGPHFAITLEAWLPVLPAPPKIVVCLRSPRAYADSTIRIYGFVGRDAVERQWAKHYHRILDVVRDYKLEATCVEFDTLVEHPQETTAALAEFIGHPLRAEFINPPLRHHARPVAKKYVGLYREVLALGRDGPLLPFAGRGAGADAEGGIAPVAEPREREAAMEPIGGEGVEAINAYVREVDDIDARTGAAKAVWTLRVGLPRAKLQRPEELGMTLPEAMEETRSASAEYASVLREAQERLEALECPPGFRQYHELTELRLNLERVVAELMRMSVEGDAPDQETLKATLRAWRRFGRSAPFDKAQERREREYARALERSGYLAARKEAAPE